MGACLTYLTIYDILYQNDFAIIGGRMNEELKTNELTFQKLFDILKRSFVRILIYGLILAILGGGIATIVTIADRDTAEYETIIEYNFAGIEEGKDPFGNNLDTSRIKSDTIINDALKNMGITEKSPQYTQTLRDNISIIGFVSSKTAQELAQGNMPGYFPSRYTIVLTESSQIGFSRTQYQIFLNELIASYKQYFKDIYNYGKVLSLSIADKALEATSDYYDLCIDYELAINKLLRELSTLEDSVPDRYNKLYSNIEVLKNELSTIESYIIGNNVSKENAPLTLFENLTSKNQDYLDLSTMYGELASSQLAAIKEYNNNTSKKTTTDGKLIEIVETESKYYDQMMKDYNSYNVKQHDYKLKADNIAKKIELVEDAEAATAQERAFVENSLLTFAKNINNTLDTINAELELYSEHKIVENGFKIAMPAVRIRTTMNYLLIVAITLISAFVGVIAAIFVTEIKVKRSIVKNGKTAQNLED